MARKSKVIQPAFIFDPNLCTGCSACVIACQIENQFPFLDRGIEIRPPSWRTIHSHNPHHDPEFPSFHLSIACNHCLEPACLKSCPASAYSKDQITGAVLIDPQKCIGCQYCSWACPYDAPKYNTQTGVMEKCTFCASRLKSHSEPACVTACPTNALTIGSLNAIPQGLVSQMNGFPRSDLQPAVRFYPLRNLTSNLPSRIITTSSKISLSHEWPLWLMTTIMPLLFAIFCGIPSIWLTHQPFIDLTFFSLGFLAIGISTLHLGKPTRAWRAVINIRTSWLSREIILFTLFLAMLGFFFVLPRLSLWNFLYTAPGLIQISTGLIGFLCLFSMDRVYDVVRFKSAPSTEIYRVRPQIHSASTVLGGLFLSALGATFGDFTKNNPFLTILIITGVLSSILQLSLYTNSHTKTDHPTPRAAWFVFLRIVIGFFVPWFLLSRGEPGWWAIGLAFVGFAIDRLEFYSHLEIVSPGW